MRTGDIREPRLSSAIRHLPLLACLTMQLTLHDRAYDLAHPAPKPTQAEPCRCRQPIRWTDAEGLCLCVRCAREVVPRGGTTHEVSGLGCRFVVVPLVT